MSEYECRYLFEPVKPNYKDITYRDLSIILRNSSDKKEIESIISELQLRESKVLQSRRSTINTGNYLFKCAKNETNKKTKTVTETTPQLVESIQKD